MLRSLTTVLQVFPLSYILTSPRVYPTLCVSCDWLITHDNLPSGLAVVCVEDLEGYKSGSSVIDTPSDLEALRPKWYSL